MLVAAAAELVTLGTILPFLGILSGTAGSGSGSVSSSLPSIVHLQGLGINVLAVIFAGAALFSGAIRILLVYVAARFNASICYEIGSQIFERTIEQSYEDYINQNSSELLQL